MVDGNCRFKPRWVTFSSGSEPDVLSIWRSLVKSLLWRNQSWPVLSSAGNMASTAAFPNTSSHVHQNTVKTYSDRKFQCLRIEERFFFFFFFLPHVFPCSSFFLCNVEFHTKKWTGGNCSETGKNSDRQQHPHILTYSYNSWSGSRVLTLMPSIAAERNNLQNGPCAFWQMLDMLCFFFFPQRLSAEIRGFKVLSYIPLKGLLICSQVISGKQSCVPRLDEAKACYSHSAASLPAEKCC